MSKYPNYPTPEDYDGLKRSIVDHETDSSIALRYLVYETAIEGMWQTMVNHKPSEYEYLEVIVNYYDNEYIATCLQYDVDYCARPNAQFDATGHNQYTAMYRLYEQFKVAYGQHTP